MMQIKYIGQQPLPHTLQTPIPYLAKSDHAGTLTFDPVAEVENDDWAAFLLENCGGAFVLVGSDDDAENKEIRKKAKIMAALEKAVGKRFHGKTGKWQAKAYVQRHGLEEAIELENTTYGWIIKPRPAYAAAADTPAPAIAAGPEVTDGHDHA